MSNNIKNTLSSFFAQKMSPQVKELFTANLIMYFGVAAVNIFEPVFLFLLLYEKFGKNVSLQFVLFFYLIVYFIYFFTLPLGAKFARKFGYEHSIAFASIFTISFYLCLFGSREFFWLVWPAALMSVLSKTFYWPAYHSDFAKFSSDGNQGRQISNLTVLNSLVFILGPLLGGVFLRYFGFGFLFILVSVIILISNIPILITKEDFDTIPFSYKDAFSRLFKKENRTRLLMHLGFGEELLVVTVWPIFIYLVVGDFLRLGFLTAIATAITTVVFLFIGRLSDLENKKIILRFGAIFYFFGWLLRLLSRSLLGVFLIDSYSRIAKQTIIIPFTAKTYERAQDTSVMNTILFFEMGLVLGKLAAIIIGLILLQFFAPGFNVLFITAAGFTLFYLFFK